MEFPTESKLIDRFVLKGLLGSGRFGTVYLAEDLLRSSNVALKIADISSYGQELAKAHLQCDININEQLSDFSYVIQVFDVLLMQWQGTVLLLQSMELADGGTFRKWLMSNKDDLKFRQTEGIYCFKHACLGIRSGHSAGVIHLDIKPENLMFCNDILKVADFGMAQLKSSFKQSTANLKNMASSDTGTPVYMSPEQFIAPHPDDVDIRSDIYTLGILLYELLHPKCRPPFSGSYHRLRDLHLSVNPSRIPGVDKKHNSIVARCLNKNPDDRYQSVGELLTTFDCESALEIKSEDELDTEGIRISERIDQLWSSASHFYKQRRFKRAGNLLDEILKILPDDIEAQYLKHEIEERFERAGQFYEEIIKNFEGDLIEQVSLLEEAVNIYPEHPTGHMIQTKIAIKTKQYCQAMQDGLNALRSERWESALACYHKAAKYNPSAEFLSTIIEWLSWVKNTKNKIDAAMQQENFGIAISLARYVDDYIDEMKESIPAIRES